MRLYHHPTCPFSRYVRVVCSEKQLAVDMSDMRAWERNPTIVLHNPSARTPMLWNDDMQLVGAYPICEWLEEHIAEPAFLFGDGAQRAEIRRLVAWFDDTFHAEVGRLVAQEKMLRYTPNGTRNAPNMQYVRAGLDNAQAHFRYLTTLLQKRVWLAGESLSLADIAAGAHVSCLDYLGDIAWPEWPQLKQWYLRLKSRPSFRLLLKDRLPGMPPVAHYAELDF